MSHLDIDSPGPFFLLISGFSSPHNSFPLAVRDLVKAVFKDILNIFPALCLYLVISPSSPLLEWEKGLPGTRRSSHLIPVT
jgi:hypothetical protein